MKTKTVSELMVPLSEYATVSEEATLYDAILALEKAQEEFNGFEYKHRAILVFNSGKQNRRQGEPARHFAIFGAEIR